FQDYITLNASFNDAITVRQLLNHTSGIADYLETGDAGDYILADDTHLFTPQEIVEDIVSETPDFAPGTDFFYSNSNYVLAAMVIEAVTQQTLAQQLRSRIWEPLGMSHSYLGAYEDYSEPVAGVWWNFGSGLQAYNSIGETSMLSFAYGCGNVVSTPSDLSIFIRAVFDGSLLSSGSFAEMTSFIPESEGAWSNGYGLGIHHASGDTQLFGHDGYYTNLTDMFHNPDIGYTVVTMTNTQTTWFQFFNQLHDVLTDYFSSTPDIDVSGKCVVWPNPADEVVYFSALPALTADHLLVHDLCGRKISETNIGSSGGIIELNVIGFPAGCYVATICGSNGHVQMQFVVE
ncbi:MAG: serine hydrolase, partial [Flavobacteriales bacterium]|nr:serine hydrolase [Flavobacteriales bacterium]